MPITQDYVLDHASRTGAADKAKAYEEFGRVVADLILRSAAKDPALMDSGKAGVNAVKLELDAKVTENVSATCATVTISTPIGSVTAHAG